MPLPTLCTHFQTVPAYIRIVPWWRDPSRAIVALEFSPTGEWLLAATVDSSLFVVPAAAILQVGQRTSLSFGS
jgi:hypothetical protein